ncbi:MAG: glutamate 5-kinase [Candidatus Omnitrophica bacterium]|nr:glutamate 5-kinase [Candidatus Omnitrophota bacterium]
MKKGIMVVKVGTAILSKGSGRLDSGRIASLTAQICKLKKLGQKIILVSSGAIGAGVEAIGISKRPSNLNKLQACAAIGQGKLMRLYEQNFSKQGKHAAQILLTREDFASKKRVLMAKHTIMSLLNDFNAVPIINENDTIAIEEIKFGDNDKLSAMVARFVGAHTLIILTDVDGLYEAKGKKAISIVKHINRDIENMARPSKSKLGRGGMVSKIQAAKIATRSGIKCIIANGRTKDILLKLHKKQALGTTFLAARSRKKGIR